MSIDFGALAGDGSVELANHAHAAIHHSDLRRSLRFGAALRRIQGAQNDAVLGAEPDVGAIAEDFAAVGEGWGFGD